MESTRERSDDDRRQDRRVEPTLTLDVVENGHRRVCAVRNVSVRGIAFESNLKPNPGDQLDVSLEGFGDLVVKVIWSNSGVVAGTFDLDDMERQRLSALLDKHSPKVLTRTV